MRRTKQKEIVIHHYDTARENGVKLPSPDSPIYQEERYTYSRNDGRGDNPVKTVPYTVDGRGVVSKDSPLLKGRSESRWGV